ncbi:MAG: hypothetical protein KIT27_07980 [Legionellales bacterium]|nr:hypothetical protein [Legionellales bacterium]
MSNSFFALNLRQYVLYKTLNPKSTSDNQSIDCGKAVSDYRKYRHGFPPLFFSQSQDYGVSLPGQKLFDIATVTSSKINFPFHQIFSKQNRLKR